MNKILIIIHREFMNRVSKKSFIILTILMPFIFAALIFVPLMLSMVKSDEQKDIAIIDHTGKYFHQFKNDESYRFFPQEKMLDEFKSDTTTFCAVIEIKSDLVKNPDDAAIYSKKEIPQGLSKIVNNALNEQIRHDKLLNYNIPELPAIMNDFNESYSIKTIKWNEDGSENESNASIAVAAGMILTFLIYMFVMSYGGMVMQSVMEEKANRIVELMISSVKPFQLMIGKITGIGLVGIFQLMIWGIMLVVILTIAGFTFGVSAATNPDMMMSAQGIQPTNPEGAVAILNSIHNLNLPYLGGIFILNFIGGYLVYASIFAAIGASINESEDSQQFMMPIVFLLIFGLYASIYSADNPDGPLAIWCSMIPFTSPIVSMTRVALDAPVWHTIVSLCILYISAFTLIWVSGKIYRVGILMYGKKPSIKEMIKWITYK